MHWPAVGAVVLLLPLAGCLDPLPACRRDDPLPSYEAGTHALRLCIEGRARTAVAVIPAHVATPAPLLLMLHGGGGNAQQMQEADGMDEAAAQLGFIVVYADGTPARRGSELRTWNAVHCCGFAFRSGAPDVEFLGRLVEGLAAAWPIDAQRVGVAGHSNGAMMAYRLAAERSDLVASVMAVAGAIGGEPDPGDPVRRLGPPEEAVSVLILHAEDDPRVPYLGGQGENLDGPRVDLSVAQAVAFWVDAAGGAAGQGPTVVERADGVPEEHHATQTGGIEVVVLTTVGGHGWPGSVGGRMPAPAVPDAAREIGAFLLAHARQ